MSERHFPRPFSPRTRKSIVLAFLTTLVLLALDLGSKEWAIRELSARRVGTPTAVCQPDQFGYTPTQRIVRPPHEIVPGFFEMRYAENCGAAFGFLNDETSVAKNALFYGAAVGCALLLAWMYATGRGGPAFALAVPLVVSGAIGNLVDRLRFGYVVDFIRFYGENWQYPTFNVADIGITVGVGLLVIDGIRESKLDREAAKRQEAHEQALAEGASTAGAADEGAVAEAAESDAAEAPEPVEDPLTGEDETPATDPTSTEA
ncbi:MAG: signal peptidase II [Polyangiales bacterium]